MSIANFKKIISGEIPVDFIFEDEQCVVFDEINRQAPIHFLVVPKKFLPNLGQAQGDEKLLGHLMTVAKNVAQQKGLERTGYHVLLDETYRKPAPTFLALHVFGRALHHMVWPTGPGCRL